MSKISAMRLNFLMLLALPVLLMACGPSTSGEGASAAVPFVGNATPVGTNDDSAALAESGGAPAEAIDAMGVAVGFTEEGRPYRGNLDAPILMEEFSDFQCPYCSRFTEETMPSLLENQIADGEVVLVFHDFPLSSIHPQAAAAANAARCAGEGGAVAFWAMHDRLFANTAEWSNNSANDVFLRYAQELGLAHEGFASCLQENRHGDAIDEDIAFGRSRGVSSTPSFFLNDQPVIGAYPLDYFNQAIAAVGAGESVAGEPEAPPQGGPTVKPTPAAIVMDNFAGERGDADAPVTIVEYTDLQCPYCVRHATETLPLIIIELIDTGRVRYVVKDFPLDAIHPEARRAAVAARCAAEQGAYWEMHDALFARQAEWNGLGDGATEVFAALAGDLSLDVGTFTSCVGSGRHDAVIQANQDEGVALGVQGTPAFFIDGFPISGAQPYELFEYAVGLAESGTLADAYVASPDEAQAEPTPSGPVEIDTEGSYSLGDDDAPVVIVEFTDYQCPFCSRHFLQTYPQIKADYVDTGKVRYVFMDFPLSSIHPQAQVAAEAARCAGAQGAYLTMHDMLFTRQQEWGGRGDAAEIFSGYVGELGLDTAAFDECLQSGQQADAVLADLERGVALGVNGTPAFFLNGNFISGAQPYEVFRQAIESLLAETG